MQKYARGYAISACYGVVVEVSLLSWKNACHEEFMCCNGSKENLTSRFTESGNSQSKRTAVKTTHINRKQTFNTSHKLRIQRISCNTQINARVANIAVTSTENGQGPEEMSPAPGHISLLSGKAEGFPVLEHILLLPEGAEEVEEAIEERVLPELAEGVRQW